MRFTFFFCFNNSYRERGIVIEDVVGLFPFLSFAYFINNLTLGNIDIPFYSFFSPATLMKPGSMSFALVSASLRCILNLSSHGWDSFL
jgi:hypothetical protein